MANIAKKLVVCSENTGFEVSLERRKIYVALPDARAGKVGQIPVIDESGEDYLFPQEYFLAIALPAPIRKAVLQTA